MSVRKRTWKTGKDGLHREAWVVDYTDQKGVRHIKTFAKKKDADAHHAKTHMEVLARVHIAPSQAINVAKAGADWITSCEAAGLEKSTVDQYKQHVNRHIVPFIGQKKLTEITVPFVRAFLDRLRAGDTTIPAGLPKNDPRSVLREPRSPAMIRAVRASLGSLLADAMERGNCTHNAVRDMGRNRKSSGAHAARHKRQIQIGTDVPTVEEVSKILQSAAEQRAKVFLMTAVWTGMRSSELRGLRWADVDFDNRQITVRQRADPYGKLGSPKSEAGRRSIPLVDPLVKALREWKLACPRMTAEDTKGHKTKVLEFVFPNGRGNIESHQNIVYRHLIQVQVSAGVTKPTGKVDDQGNPILTAKYPGLHALRHFYASWCINRREDGGLALPPKTVQGRLGHSSIQMTLDVYGHLFPKQEDNTVMDESASAMLTKI